MKKLVIIICLIFGFHSYAQNTEEEYIQLLEQAALDEEYGEFTKKLSNFYYSDENMYQKYYEETFFGKLGSENEKEVCTMSDDEFKDWINNNLSKTEFSSIEEAISIRKNFWKYNKIKDDFYYKTRQKVEMYKKKYGLIIHITFNDMLTYGEISSYKRFLEKNNL